jgi:hypothetical protein
MSQVLLLFVTQATQAYADLVVRNLTVSGTTTTINTETVTIADNILRLNSDYSGSSPTENAGFEVNRGSLTAASIIWDEANDRFVAGLAGSELAIARYFAQTFTSASLVGGVLTVTHNLGQRVVPVTLVDNNFKKIGDPDDITYTSATALALDMTSFGTITGTWTVLVG